jgi:hypothetical protein
MAELMFGEDEVLVAAKDLVNDCSVRIVEGGTVEYFHLLFDSHQIVWSEGLETESFLPGPSVMTSSRKTCGRRFWRCFPRSTRRATRATVPSARLSLKAHEARAIGAGY